MERWIIKTGLWMAVLLMAIPSLAQAQEKVVQYLGPTVRTFTVEGEPNGKIDASKLPRPPVDIVGEARGHPGIKVGSETIYLKSADIMTAGAASECQPLTVNSKSNSTHLGASEIGVSHGLSAQSIHCVVATPKQ
jgi:hypothetical protein